MQEYCLRRSCRLQDLEDSMAYSKNRKYPAKHNKNVEFIGACSGYYVICASARGCGAPRETHLFEGCRDVPSCQLHIRHLQTPTHKEIHDSCPRFFRYGDSMARTVKSSIYAWHWPSDSSDPSRSRGSYHTEHCPNHSLSPRDSSCLVFSGYRLANSWIYSTRLRLLPARLRKQPRAECSATARRSDGGSTNTKYSYCSSTYR